MDWGDVRNFVDNFNQHWDNLAYAVLVVLGTLVVTLVIHLILRKRYKRQNRSRHIWRDAVLGALNAPLQCVVWIIGLSIAVDALSVGGHMPILAKVFPPARDVAAIVTAAWFLVRVTRRSVRNLHWRALAQGKHFDETAADAIGKLVCALIIVIAALIVMQVLGFSIASLLTFGGVLGIALGFAAQGLAANLLGGITIYASRPFSVGEYIIFPGTTLMGEVEHIGWRATRVLGFNGKPFYVPNAKFNTETIINHSRMAYREIAEYVYVRLEDIDKVAAIVADVQRMIKEHKGLHHDFFMFNFDGYGDHELKLFLYTYTIATSYVGYKATKADALLKIAAIVHDHDAELAVPINHVLMPEGLSIQGEHSTGAPDPASSGSTPPPPKN